MYYIYLELETMCLILRTSKDGWKIMDTFYSMQPFVYCSDGKFYQVLLTYVPV